MSTVRPRHWSEGIRAAMSSLLAIIFLPAIFGLAASVPPQVPSIRTASEDIAPGIHTLLAAVQPQEGCTYSWSILGGTIDSGARTDQISFGAGTGSSVTLQCTVTNAAGQSAVGSLTLPIPTGGLSPLPTTTIGGQVQGLTGGTLALQNNQGNNLRLTANGPFTFGIPVASGDPYSVTVLSQPDGQNCTVTHGSGIVGQASVSDVAVTCVQILAYRLGAPVKSLGARVTASLTTAFTQGASTESLFEIINALVTDLDGDGYPEVVLGITTYPNQVPQPILVIGAKTGVSLLSDSMFSGGVPTAQNPSSMVATDLNGDGLPDLVIGAAGIDHPPWTGAPIAVALNSGGGKFQNVSGLVPASTSTGRSYAIAAGDLHHDGKVEIILPAGGIGKLPPSETLHWNGSGFDEDPSWIDQHIWSHPNHLLFASCLGVADLDGDGFQDVVVSGNNQSPSLRVLYGSAKGFQLYDLDTLPEGIWGHTPFLLDDSPGNPISQGGNLDRVVIADFNGDGRPDLFAIAEKVTYYQPGAFTDQNDFRYPDLSKNGGSAGENSGLQVLLNRGDRVFENVATESTLTDLGRKYYVAAWATDLNGDGAMDVVGTYYTKGYGSPGCSMGRGCSQRGLAWGSTFFLNDGTGAFQVVDAGPLFAEVLNLSNLGEIQLGSLFPTKVGRNGIEGVLVLNRADNPNLTPKSFVIEKIATERSIGTGPGLVDGAALGAPGFNEFFYLHTHPDVAALVRAGQYTSGLDHYLKAGRGAGYQAFAQHTTAWGGSTSGSVTLYGSNVYHCGSSGDTVHVSGGSNDVHSGSGNDTFSGGTGSDVIIYSGARSRYQIRVNQDSSITVADSLAGGDGTDTITGRFTLRFTDKSEIVDSCRRCPRDVPFR